MTTKEMDVNTAIDVVCEVAFDWCGEYGFTNPERATKIWDAAVRLAPHLEPKEDG